MIILVVFCGVNLPLPVYALEGNENPAYASLDNIDAMQAMAIANQWKWTRKEGLSLASANRQLTR